jgi:DNA-binding transcriptional LysR family regulator
VLTNHERAPLVRAVAAGDVDVAVLGIGHEPLPPEVRAREVASEPLVLGVRHDHPLAQRKTIALADLRDHPMITLTHESALRGLLERACRDAGFSPKITAETGELRSLVDLVAEGLGVAVVPRSVVERADLAILEITRPRLHRRTALAWNESVTSPAGRAFLALAEHHFA